MILAFLIIEEISQHSEQVLLAIPTVLAISKIEISLETSLYLRLHANIAFDFPTVESTPGNVIDGKEDGSAASQLTVRT